MGSDMDFGSYYVFLQTLKTVPYSSKDKVKINLTRAKKGPISFFNTEPKSQY